MNVKLNNGNVASRILPIKIHDLDTEDKLLLESELGGGQSGVNPNRKIKIGLAMD